MNLVDGLLALDKEDVLKKETAKVEIKRLSKLTGEPFMVEVQAISARRYQEIQSDLLNKNGSVDYSKIYEVNQSIVMEGVINPNLRDQKLLDHFDVRTPRELTQILFQGGDMVKLADLIANVSGFSDEDEKEQEDEIKN
ncbi:phage tail assembly chaperone [Anaeromicropila herbilytica]|uniref:Uncharacterized protein n=1 Tax=Anaeromicropila herbilytica TaxID=2785025 RepID=A0A7R7ENM8_9FIRM|nr:hypothetical protein [Anaeromicropila herbilytica]BCN32069.1 hypothetical protein bsdtb5_33640 [Anaeromicropila herbilytica]